jgi:hypothetical protein
VLVHVQTRVFAGWVIEAFLESAVLSILSLRFLEYDDWGGEGSHWEAGALCFSAVVIVANMKV